MDINLIAPINPLGYGVVGYNILKHLDAAGHNVGFFPIGEPNWVGDPGLQELLNKTIKSGHFFNKSAPSLRIWHQFDLAMSVGSGPKIGWPIFELDKFTEKEIHHLSSLDTIIVCSNWAKTVIEENGITVPTHVVPLGVDPNIFKCIPEERNSRPKWTKDATVFINIGKWEKRKGHEELLEAFCSAFVDEDNVELWMINDNPFIGSENLQWRKKYVSSSMGRHVKFFPRLEKHEHIAKIFNHVDCGVFPSHAEGWNLEILELMACGASIIATDYSGHCDFLTDENSHKIDATGKEPAVDGKWFNGQGNWCTYDVAQLVEKFKKVHRVKQEFPTQLNQFGIETAAKFTWENSVKKLESILEPVCIV